MRIIKSSLLREDVPSSWKKSVIIPLFKKADPTKASNFRPITKVPRYMQISRENNRRLVEHRDNNYSLELLFSL